MLSSPSVQMYDAHTREPTVYLLEKLSDILPSVHRNLESTPGLQQKQSWGAYRCRDDEGISHTRGRESIFSLCACMCMISYLGFYQW
jgi:hypothetical protein